MLNDLLTGNQAWSAQRHAEDPGFFGRLVAQQAPEYFWIGCSDSRVPANVVTGLDPGEVFVHRNVANVVHSTDMNLLSALEFAVEVLKVREIIVCGHHGCGGVEAVLDGRRAGLVDHWLHEVDEVREEIADELARLPDRARRSARLAEANVAAQVAKLCRTQVVRDAWTAGRSLAVHGWIYDIADGRLRDLGVTRTGRPKTP